MSIDPATADYNGSAQEPTVTVRLGEKNLNAVTDYTVAYTDAAGQSVSDLINAGTYTVTVTGAGNYEGTATAFFTIRPAALTITGAALEAKTYDGTANAEVTGVTFGGVQSTDTLTLNTDYTVTAIYNDANAGTDKTVNGTVTRKNGNYTLTSDTFQLTGQTIEKANLDLTQQIITGYVGIGRSSIALPTLPDGASYNRNISFEGTLNFDSSAVLDKNGILLRITCFGISEETKCYVTIPVNGGSNYNDTSLAGVIIALPKDSVDITGVTAQNGTYNGQEQTGYTGTPSAEGFTGKFTVTYNTADGSAPTDAGTYGVTISIPDGAGVIGSYALSFTIEKAALTVAAPSKAITVGDEIPNLASLQPTISGLVDRDTFSGVTLAYQSTPSSSAAGTYTIMPSGGSFTTGNPDNYDIQYVSGTLTVQAASTPVDPVDPVDPVVPSTPDTSHSSDDDDDDGYSVSVPASSSIRGGSITVSPRSADKGDTVTITVKPDQGYVLETLTVTTRAGSEVDLTQKNSTQYTFTMPAGAVGIDVSFVPEDQAAEIAFADVTESYWAHDEIAWAYENGYMNGVSAAAFNPGGTVSRQQVWMILARMAGADPADMAAAKAWAVANGISDGTSPGAPVTRQQLATLLYRYAVQNGYDVSVGEDTNILSYSDFADLSEYAIPAMQWACGAGILNGTGDGSTLSPQGSATRAQLAVMLYRWLA